MVHIFKRKKVYPSYGFFLGALLVLSSLSVFALLDWRYRSDVISLRTDLNSLLQLEMDNLRGLASGIYWDLQILTYRGRSIFEGEPNDFYEVASTKGIRQDLKYRALRIYNLEGVPILGQEFSPRDGMTPLSQELLNDEGSSLFLEKLAQEDRQKIYIALRTSPYEKGGEGIIQSGKVIQNAEGQDIGFLTIDFLVSSIWAQDKVNVFSSNSPLRLGPIKRYSVNKEGRVTLGGAPGRSLKEDNPRLWAAMEEKLSGSLEDRRASYAYVLLDLAEYIPPELWNRVGLGTAQIFYMVYEFDKTLLDTVGERVQESHFLAFMVFLFMTSFILAHLFSWLFEKGHRRKIRLVRSSRLDEMTNCLNRATGLRELREAIEVPPLSLILIDLDNLKGVNDNYGHLAGDKYILAVVSMVRTVLRQGDSMIRLGGDEFLLILPGCAYPAAQMVRSRIAVREDRLNQEKRFPYPISVSCGVYEVPPDEKRSTTLILDEVDKLMYEEKRLKKARSRGETPGE